MGSLSKRTRLSIPVETTNYFFFLPAFFFFLAATRLTSDLMMQVYGSVFSGKFVRHCAGTVGLYVKATSSGKCFF
jgi:hypothetical protein